MVLAWQTHEVKSNNPVHSHRQSKKPASQSRATVLAMATVKVKNDSHSPRLSQSHSPSQSQSQRPGHGHSPSPSQVHATTKVTVKSFFSIRSNLNWIKWETLSHWSICPFIDTSTAGHGHSHSPSHSHVIIRTIIISSLENPHHSALDQWERFSHGTI